MTATVLFFFDLDDFKYINDTMGHVAGDTVLASVAHRFLSAMRPGDVLGRIGGDEFALLIKGGLTEEETTEYIGKLMTRLKNIWVKDSTRIDIRASAGAAFFPKDSENLSELLQCADSAMYQSKHSGKGRIMFFTPQMREALSRSIAVEREMHDALKQGELSVAFQPQYENSNAAPAWFRSPNALDFANPWPGKPGRVYPQVRI